MARRARAELPADAHECRPARPAPALETRRRVRDTAPPTPGPPRRRHGSSLSKLLDLRPAAGVQHLLLAQPRTARLGDAHLDVLQGAQLMRVGVDCDLDT